jgi:methionyl-tRNA formyltransferase
MRLIFFGNPEFAVPSLKKLASSSHDVVCAVTSPERPSGRGRKLKAPEVKTAAEQLGLPVVQVQDLKDASFLEKIARFAVSLFVVVAFRILPVRLFEIPPLGAVNLHASILPKYRGAAPINRAIMAGETLTGVTTFQIRKRVDTGDVLLQHEEPISPDDNFDSLHDRLSLLGADVLLETVDGLEKRTLKPITQDPALASKAPKLQPGEGEIDWSRPAEVINNRIRGLSSTPGAFTYRNGGKLKIFLSKPIEASRPGLEPGEVVPGSGLDGLVVAGGTGWLRILELQPAGKKRMTADDYLRGYPLVEGEVLG